MGLEAGTVARGEGALEIVGDELDGLSAHDGAATAEQHGSVLPHLGLEHGAQPRPPAVQEHPLVGIADTEHLARFHEGFLTV